MSAIEVRTRDYAAAMREFIDQYRTSSKGYNAGLIAGQIFERLLEEDRELLYGWLEAHAVNTIRTAITQVDAATRAHARANGPASVFADAAKEAEKGNLNPLKQGFLQAVYVINVDNDRKALKDMSADDVLFVAASYDDRARSAKFEAAFFREVAKKIGSGRRVADSFNNVQLAELRNRITGK